VKKVLISVSNDLATDQRVQRHISMLLQKEYKVNFIGRKLPQSLDFSPEEYQVKRFRLIFNTGFLFYANFNVRLFFYLLFTKADLYFSNDLDTLLPNYLASKLFGKPLIYDSHEYFTGVPEIQNRPKVKWFWTRLEATIFPHLKHLITVNESIADLYETDYGIRPVVIRNVASKIMPEKKASRKDLALPEEAILIINQGSGINVDRGMEEMLAALKLLPKNYHFVLVGKGDVFAHLKQKAQEYGLGKRVHFISSKPYLEMLQYTLNADIGVSLDKDTNINYRFSLPNKIFDYMKCGIPLLVSNLKEPSALVLKYEIGLVTSVDAQEIAQAILKITEQNKSSYGENLQLAAAENNWEKESIVLAEILAKIKS
jgi:glycosyltransferase involved in cell wall biosynthesis